MSCRVLITAEAEDELKNLPLTPVQREHVVEVLLRLGEFDDPSMVSDLQIQQLSHFYEVRQLFETGGPLINQEVQVRFGFIERDDDIVVLQIVDTFDNPNTVEMIVLEDRYAAFLETGAARALA